VASRVREILWGRLLKQSGYLVLAVFVAIFLFVLISSNFLGWRFDAVLTGSMSPTYRIGGTVVIRPVDPLTVEVGNVITYKPPGQTDFLVTHRVVEMYNEGESLSFQTKGDGVEVEDNYIVPAENVRGEVWFYIPLFGHFAEFVKTPIGAFLCLIVPGGLLIFGEYRSITTAVREKKRKNKTAHVKG
jgi:signal peptidase